LAEVLIVDDDPDIRVLLAFALEDSGFLVRQAADGAAALEALEQKAPDAVVLDVMMPGVDGFGVLRGMRERRLAPDTRVMLLTCKTEERDFLRGWELGAHEYLNKPFDPDALVARLRELLAADAEVLEARRASELQKAELLDRLEHAFTRSTR
jgi:two-component system OmpR family response regulator